VAEVQEERTPPIGNGVRHWQIAGTQHPLCARALTVWSHPIWSALAHRPVSRADPKGQQRISPDSGEPPLTRWALTPAADVAPDFVGRSQLRQFGVRRTTRDERLRSMDGNRAAKLGQATDFRKRIDTFVCRYFRLTQGPKRVLGHCVRARKLLSNWRPIQYLRGDRHRRRRDGRERADAGLL
jgi:hypothetical protein